MNFSYKVVYDKQYEYKGVIYGFDPHLPLPVPHEDPNYGKTLKEFVGMTDQEALDIVTNAKWTQIRSYRDSLLKECDWVSGEDVPQAIKDKWYPYRQALRDITNQEDLDNITWPEKPL